MLPALHRHLPFYVGLGAAAALYVADRLAGFDLAIAASASLFFVVYLAMMLAGAPKMSSAYLRKHAASADEPVWILFLVVLVAIVVAVASLFLLLNSGKAPTALDATLTLASVPFGWLTIHMMTAVHYAHLFWQPERGGGDDDDGDGDDGASPRGGLDFPQTSEPAIWDFLYFSYVIGMTSQTSDTAITQTQMRRVVLAHSIVSFFFNTVLVAAAVNAAVALGK